MNLKERRMIPVLRQIKVKWRKYAEENPSKIRQNQEDFINQNRKTQYNYEVNIAKI